MRDPRSKVVAFDPGLNGAYAVLGFEGEFIACDELPRAGSMLNYIEIGRLLASYIPERIILEKVGAMPKQGVSSTFTFGTAYGICIGAAGCSGASLSFVAPNAWKSFFRLTRKEKDASRELALRLYPEAAGFLTLKRHHGRADALLMARYALCMETGEKFT